MDLEAQKQKVWKVGSESGPNRFKIDNKIEGKITV